MAMDQTPLYALLARMAQHDKTAFSPFYDATSSRIFGIIMRITCSKELAEEVTSDVYMQVWRTASHYDADLASPMTWLIMIARSRAIDSLRREKSATKNQCPIVDDYEVADDESSGPMMATVWAEKHEKLKELLIVLNAVERQMVTLAFYRGMSHTEIAAHTGRPLGSVKTILRRAQSALKSAFKRGYILTPLSHHVI